METGEDIDKSISGFLSRYVRGEAIGYLSGREIVKMLEIKKKIAKDKEVSVELERRYAEITKEKILGEVTYKLAGRDFDINNQHNLVLKSFLDMKVFYKLLMTRENGKTVGIILSKELIKDKGISFEELDKAAYENTKANEMKFEFLEENQGIITSETGVDGAAALLYGDFLEEVAEKYGSDFYIIPSRLLAYIAYMKVHFQYRQIQLTIKHT